MSNLRFVKWIMIAPGGVGNASVWPPASDVQNRHWVCHSFRQSIFHSSFQINLVDRSDRSARFPPRLEVLKALFFGECPCFVCQTTNVGLYYALFALQEIPVNIWLVLKNVQASSLYLAARIHPSQHPLRITYIIALRCSKKIK